MYSGFYVNENRYLENENRYSENIYEKIYICSECDRKKSKSRKKIKKHEEAPFNYESLYKKQPWIKQMDSTSVQDYIQRKKDIRLKRTYDQRTFEEKNPYYRDMVLEQNDGLYYSVYTIDTYKIQNKFHSFENLLIEFVDPTDVLPYLMKTLDNNDFSRIREISKYEPEDGMKELLKLMHSPINRHWGEFVLALKRKGYQYVLGVVEGKILGDTTKYQREKKKLTHSAPKICGVLIPSEICPMLLADNVINMSRYQEIMAHERYNGESNAALTLLGCIWRYHQHWFHLFLKALKQYDYTRLIEEIDPDFDYRELTRLTLSSEAKRANGQLPERQSRSSVSFQFNPNEYCELIDISRSTD